MKAKGVVGSKQTWGFLITHMIRMEPRQYAEQQLVCTDVNIERDFAIGFIHTLKRVPLLAS